MQSHDSHKSNIGAVVRWELIWLIVQFVVLVSGIVYSYASIQSRIEGFEKTLSDHITQHSSYLTRELWSNRNVFIDEKLDRIETKLDQLVAHDISRVTRK